LFFCSFVVEECSIYNSSDIHPGHGMGKGEGECSKTLFVNAAMVVGEEKKRTQEPVVVDL
jgi:hypothetical protein